MEFHQYKNFFIAYAKSYLTGSEEFDRNIRLKLDHTLRVLSYSEEIIGAEAFNAFDAKTSRFAALWHDVSRFEQFKRLETYMDGPAFDHGDEGAKLLENGVFSFEGFTPLEKETIIRAVKLHNKRAIPENSSMAEKSVRDADKLDVLNVILDELDNPRNPKVLYSLSTENRFSEKVLDFIRRREVPFHRDLETVNDFVISKVAWVFDLNTKAAKRIFYREHFLERLISHMAESDTGNALVCEVRTILENTMKTE